MSRRNSIFGEKYWIEAAGRGRDQDWQRWNMFTHNVAGTDEVPADLATIVLPVARKVLQASRSIRCSWHATSRPTWCGASRRGSRR